MTMKPNKVIRLLFAAFLIPIGAVLILLDTPGTVGDLVSKMGLALIVAGIVSSFHELIMRPLEADETAETVAAHVQKGLRETPLHATGIRLLRKVRKGYSGYYNWALDSEPQDVFFAGRSILHRIDWNFRQKGLGAAEDVIARRLSQGAQIRILFLDPRSNLVPRLANEEGQTKEQFLSDLTTSIGICERLNRRLEKSMHQSALLDVRIYDEVPYFAYHRVDEDVIVGFYFSSALGHNSAAYEVVDSQTRVFFESHFLAIFNRAAAEGVLLRKQPNQEGAELNSVLLTDVRNSISNTLSVSVVDKLIAGETL